MKKRVLTMCKFYSGFGGVRGADSRIDFPVLPDRKSLRESATKTYTSRCVAFPTSAPTD